MLWGMAGGKQKHLKNLWIKTSKIKQNTLPSVEKDGICICVLWYWKMLPAQGLRRESQKHRKEDPTYIKACMSVSNFIYYVCVHTYTCLGICTHVCIHRYWERTSKKDNHQIWQCTLRENWGRRTTVLRQSGPHNELPPKKPSVEENSNRFLICDLHHGSHSLMTGSFIHLYKPRKTNKVLHRN